MEVRRGGLWAKDMGLKQAAIGNPWGTLWDLWEHIRNSCSARIVQVGL